MRQQHGGNGSGRFNVHTADMGGWVRVHTDKLAHVPDDLGTFLSASLTDWFRHRPHLRLKCVVPIQRDGTTVELHAWYEAHVFPPSALAPTGKQSEG